MTASQRDYGELPQEFDTLYKEEKHALRRAVDKVFQKDAVERLRLSLNECKNAKGKRVLDIGCGLGYLAIQLATEGAEVVGISSSENRLGKLESVAERKKLQDRFTLIQDDFAKHVFNGKFNISLALGFFDFTEDPAFHLKKMRSITTQKCIMSFPSKLAFNVPLRMIWFHSRNFPIRFYTKNELKRLFLPHFTHYAIRNMSTGYFCVASV